MPSVPRRLGGIILSSVVAAAALTVGTARSVVANHGQSFASVVGSYACSSGNCQDGWGYESQEGAHDWSAPHGRASGSGGLGVDHELTFHETYAPDGTLVSVTVSGHIRARNSNGGRVAASASYDIEIPAPGPTITIGGTATGQTAGSSLIVSDSDFELEAGCETDSDPEPITFDIDSGAGEPGDTAAAPIALTLEAPTAEPGDDPRCSIGLSAFVDSSTNRAAPGESGFGDLSFSITISTGQTEGCSGIGGKVADGGAADGHDNWLAGVRVELRRDGQRVGQAVATDEEGAYCIRAGSGVEAGAFKLRVTLVDAEHDAPLFETRHVPDTEPAFKEVDVDIDDFGPDGGADVSFVGGAEQPWLDDVANIHWQSHRFVHWVTDTLGIAPATLGPFVVNTFDTAGTSYTLADHTVHINSDGTPKDDSAFADRDEAGDEGPDNAEWHEIGHHLAHALSIAPTNVAPACAGRIPHGGWVNATTCDSLAEGFATFIAVLASVDIDADRGEGYGDDHYASFGLYLEANDVRPWTWFSSGGKDIYREDFAVSQLLWDLADDTPDEDAPVDALDPVDPGHPFSQVSQDRVALGGPGLVQLLAQIRPTTVDELYRGLLASPSVPSTLKAVDVDLFGDDDVADLTPLAEVFLIHGFHPVEHDGDPRFVAGSPVGRTDHEASSTGLTPRPHVDEAPGANLRLQNPSAQPVSVTVVVETPAGARTRTVAVAPGSERLLYMEPVPYWRTTRPVDGALPACDADAKLVATITISAPGQTPRSLDACEYAELVAATTGSSAVTYLAAPGAMPASPDPDGAGGSAERPDAAPAGAVAAGLAGLVVLVVLVGTLVAVAIRRRRSGARAGEDADA